MKLCKANNCGRVADASKGYCWPHYKKLLMYGNANTILHIKQKGKKCSILDCNLECRCKDLCKKHYANYRYWNIPEVRRKTIELARNNHYRKHPRYSLELQDAMVNVRIRDKNTCQWYDCGLIHRDVPIHVHHIFPRSEYPELELIEKYMICYCANHHELFHRYRGDSYSWLVAKKRRVIDLKTL